MLKNPLADPGIIGISSGAGFVSVVVMAFVPALFFLTPLFAFLGGVAAYRSASSQVLKETITGTTNFPKRKLNIPNLFINTGICPVI